MVRLNQANASNRTPTPSLAWLVMFFSVVVVSLYVGLYSWRHGALINKREIMSIDPAIFQGVMARFASGVTASITIGIGGHWLGTSVE